ncbi:hypothetical protein K505DRAFT_257553 [Melanomma pulvis-pyrius CBS 109.77]|uniref:Zn(2)-C6 fungal-type domain-containing protein n=1 Tax=Melanomma pulvis-pyrius CBS 109.77 TaxID=1314802 RepID=A0A6A6WUD5_9PLEO|nr:hypothetical protein K505DRAFT_257553 [Melanomma pulvis-pyrius CBS 109.77]
MRPGGRTKVKSGCRTCKIRKVKCDEGRPACQRCISTGRVCDGYGIWGGGGNAYGDPQRLTISKSTQVIHRPLLSGIIDDKGYLEWFKCRTAIKIPGTFRSNFWSTLLPQASFSEPAVLHAVLALSSVHKRQTVNTDAQRLIRTNPDQQEQFGLRNYVKSIKAIGHLKPHCSIKDRASFRVALITCVVFVCLEFLRGHFETGLVHLRNGISILREMKILSNRNDAVARLKSRRDSTDDWIIEALSRLHLQVELFQYTFEHPNPNLCLQGTWQNTPASIFHSIFEGWQELERLLNGIIYLTHQARRQAVPGCVSAKESLELLEHQQHIKESLVQWLATWEAFEQSWGPASEERQKAYLVLHVFHSMGAIMVNTCLHPRDEMIFDYHTNQFIFLIMQLAGLRDVHLIKTLPGHLMDMSRSVVDFGWIPPLYITAVKCRVHRIRLQAIRLLESTSHREGIWDAKITACVARKVMEIEERDFYENEDTEDFFPLDSLPTPRDLDLPVLPDSHRLREVEVVLSGAPVDRILLFCKRMQHGLDCRVLLSEFDVHLQRWKD